MSTKPEGHTPGPWVVGEADWNERGNARYELVGIKFLCAPDARLIAAAPELLTVVQIAYTILADIRHQWEGRHTAEGQGALAAMRDAIAKATGRDPKDVQDEAQS